MICLLNRLTTTLLHPIDDWLESIEIRSSHQARWFCRVIPARCPFARDVKLFNHTLFHIPPLCKLNPFYEQLMQLRLKALTYLVDEYREDITMYC
ncbi:MAG: Mo-dependent nitrogenase C-terminal domain-containing protein [Synechococcales cyanobacterium M58_A2018_015]|nr:Mo-dependent nitrogenase C-terminal domain-containing protein [Synechococcales cyanobacterium M58_A2018_015]